MQRLADKILFIMLSIMVVSVFFPPALVAAEEIEEGKVNTSPTNIAHRGASGQAPENTLIAFDKAIEYQADFFELDVQMTKDGQLILMHDTTIDRTTDGTGAIKDLTFEEIKQLDAGSWFGESFAGEKVPTFEEALDRYAGEIGILIELKSPELYPGIERKVADELAKRNLDTLDNGQLIVQSFNWESIKTFHNILPSIPTGVLISNGQTIDGEITNEQLEDFSFYAKYVNPNKNLLNEATVNRIHQYSLKTWAYTVKDRKWATKLTDWGVDGIITDYPIFVNMPISSNSIKTLVERFEGKEFPGDIARKLAIHLTTVNQYEQKQQKDKVYKHMNGFKELLYHEKENAHISEKAFNILTDEANYLINEW
ncbi:MAG TPA: glycerophosphodiester phosphodiesterase family protein [Candidatus Dormibacteraeota bacterium]|nr:glycerophosphodiester phosphodiesterase family protein [Candidatus Dormibacteraeota bacterium]